MSRLAERQEAATDWLRLNPTDNSKDRKTQIQQSIAQLSDLKQNLIPGFERARLAAAGEETESAAGIFMSMLRTAQI